MTCDICESRKAVYEVNQYWSEKDYLFDAYFVCEFCYLNVVLPLRRLRKRMHKKY